MLVGCSRVVARRLEDELFGPVAAVCHRAELLCLRLSRLQAGLPETSRFRGIHSCLQITLFKEISPAFVVIRWCLRRDKFPESIFRILAAFDHFNHARGQVGTNIVAD